MTVYKHSATEADMVVACTSHWIELHPPADVEPWAATAERLGSPQALSQRRRRCGGAGFHLIDRPSR
jgi:hypothetical protein